MHPSLMSRARHVVVVILTGRSSMFGAGYFGRRMFGKRMFG